MDFASLPKDYVVTSGQFTRKVHTNIYPAIDPTKPENSLKGKVVVVTGASRGIGARGIAPAFAKAGVKAIVLIATNATKLVGVAEQLKAINPNIETLTLSADISSAEKVAQAWSEINAKYSKIHVLINNAGVESTESEKMMHEQNPDVFFKNFEINVKGTHIMTSHFLRAGLPWASPTDKVRVITMTSSTAWGVWPFLAAYSMSKAANIHYTTNLAATYPDTLLTIAVNPGMNDTEILPQVLKDAGFDFNDPSLTGGAIVWLVANLERSGFLHGRVLTSEWDVDELVDRKAEIVGGNKLTLQLQATLGAEQFSK